MIIPTYMCDECLSMIQKNHRVYAVIENERIVSDLHFHRKCARAVVACLISCTGITQITRKEEV